MMADWPESRIAAVSLLAVAIHSVIGAIRAIRVMRLDVRPMRESEQE
jgi:hypothetical protein